MYTIFSFSVHMFMGILMAFLCYHVQYWPFFLIRVSYNLGCPPTPHVIKNELDLRVLYASACSVYRRNTGMNHHM